MIVVLFSVNLRLYMESGTVIAPDAPVHANVAAQLRFLRRTIEIGADADMQRLFPEGRFFMNCLYGLANVEAGLREVEDSPAREVFWKEARWALARVDSPENRAVFPATLRPCYGIFFAGWSAALHAGTLALQPESARDPDDKAALRARCDAIAAAFTASRIPYLQVYQGASWSCDSAVAIFALHACDHVLEPRYAPVIDRWIAGVRERRDAATGLLGHRVSAEDGGLIDGPRATSMSITLRFLGEAAPGLAGELYSNFREHMMTTRLGIPGVREYPKGVNGPGDVDSGPLVFGISTSASVVTMGVARIMGDAEALAMPVSWIAEKRYLARVLPVADAFIAWSQTARPWFAKTTVRPYPQFVPSWWRLPLHGVSIAIVLLIASGLLKRRWTRRSAAQR